MKTLATALCASLLLIVASGARAQVTPTCDDFRCQFQQRLDTDCPCGVAKNHGQYVSCVAHIVNDLVAEGLPTNCKGKLTRCAAHSVCGKEGVATCTTFTYGTCVPGDPTGTCDNDPSVSCTVDTDCVISSQCKLTRHTDECQAAGGIVNLAPTCCSTCSIAP